MAIQPNWAQKLWKLMVRKSTSVVGAQAWEARLVEHDGGVARSGQRVGPAVGGDLVDEPRQRPRRPW